MNPLWLLLALALIPALVLVSRPERWAGVLRGVTASPLELTLVLVVCAVTLAAVTGGSFPPGWALASLFAVVLFAGRDQLSNYLDGVSVRWASDFERGDTLEIDGHTGVVAEINRRGVVLEDDRGRLWVPHRKLAHAIVHQRRAASGALPHRFELDWSADRHYDEVAEIVVRAALLNPWVVPGRRPELDRRAQNRAVVTVYSVDPARAFEVERTIREALVAPAPP